MHKKYQHIILVLSLFSAVILHAQSVDDFKQQKLNERNELESVKNIVESLKSMLDRSIDYSVSVKSGPYVSKEAEGEYIIPVEIEAKFNSNVKLFTEYFEKMLKGVGMSLEEKESYVASKKEVHLLHILSPSGSRDAQIGNQNQFYEAISRANYANKYKDGESFAVFFRNAESVKLVNSFLFVYFPKRNIRLVADSGEVYVIGEKTSSHLSSKGFTPQINLVKIMYSHVEEQDSIYDDLMVKQFVSNGGFNTDYFLNNLNRSPFRDKGRFLYVFLRTFKPNSMIFKIKMDLPVRENILAEVKSLKVSGIRNSDP